VTFTIVDSATNAEVNISGDVTIVYDADGVGTTASAGSAMIITADTNDVYDLNTVLSGGMAADANSTVTISYKVASTDAVLDEVETTKVELIPGNGGEANNNSVPTVTDPIITDITTVKGLTLTKTQALDADCSGSATDASFSQNAVDATPDECVVYRILAANTFTTLSEFSINDVVISEPVSNFDTNADYVASSAVTTTSGTTATITGPTKTGTEITTTVDPLVFDQTATLQYSIKIKANPS